MFLCRFVFARVMVITCMFYLGQAEEPLTHDIREMNLLSTITARERCQICLAGTRCEIVKMDFTRKQMKKGYNYLATLPSGACNVTVIELTKTENNLALRWTLGKEEYYFNGGWMIKKSGNYSAGGNFFQYKRHGSFRDDSADLEYIKFTSQLSLGVDVYLIVESSNPGVEFSYALPPIRKVYQESPTKTQKEHVTEEAKRVANENATIEELPEVGGGKHQLIEAEQSYVPYFFRRQSADGSSVPSWVADLKNMLVKWKEQLDKQIKESQRLKADIANNGNRIAAHGNRITAHGNRIAALETKHCESGSSVPVNDNGNTIHFSRQFSSTPKFTWGVIRAEATHTYHPIGFVLSATAYSWGIKFTRTGASTFKSYNSPTGYNYVSWMACGK